MNFRQSSVAFSTVTINPDRDDLVTKLAENLAQAIHVTGSACTHANFSFKQETG